MLDAENSHHDFLIIAPYRYSYLLTYLCKFRELVKHTGRPTLRGPGCIEQRSVRP